MLAESARLFVVSVLPGPSVAATSSVAAWLVDVPTLVAAGVAMPESGSAGVGDDAAGSPLREGSVTIGLFTSPTIQERR